MWLLLPSRLARRAAASCRGQVRKPAWQSKRAASQAGCERTFSKNGIGRRRTAQGTNDTRHGDGRREMGFGGRYSGDFNVARQRTKTQKPTAPTVSLIRHRERGQTIHCSGTQLAFRPDVPRGKRNIHWAARCRAHQPLICAALRRRVRPVSNRSRLIEDLQTDAGRSRTWRQIQGRRSIGDIHRIS